MSDLSLGLKRKYLYSISVRCRISRICEISGHSLYFGEISIFWKLLFSRNFRNNRPNVSFSLQSQTLFQFSRVFKRKQFSFLQKQQIFSFPRKLSENKNFHKISYFFPYVADKFCLNCEKSRESQHLIMFAKFFSKISTKIFVVFAYFR